jgi:hypothetical protein
MLKINWWKISNVWQQDRILRQIEMKNWQMEKTNTANKVFPSR